MIFLKIAVLFTTIMDREKKTLILVAEHIHRSPYKHPVCVVGGLAAFWL